MRLLFLVFVVFILMSVNAIAEDAGINMPDTDVVDQSDNDVSKSSPWLAIPMISSDPKVGTSGGGMVGYLFKLDAESTSSMVGAGGTYSTTDSLLGGVFLLASWGTWQQRILYEIWIGVLSFVKHIHPAKISLKGSGMTKHLGFGDGWGRLCFYAFPHISKHKQHCSKKNIATSLLKGLHIM